jgi:hypothetical protein
MLRQKLAAGMEIVEHGLVFEPFQSFLGRPSLVPNLHGMTVLPSGDPIAPDAYCHSSE